MKANTILTRFLDAGDVATLVRSVGVRQAIAQVAGCLREDFLRWQEFEKSARLASHSPVGVIELMPVSDGARFAYKYVNGHPRNAQFALPTVMACGMLADVQTGFPLLMADLTLATALRTAATSALAARAMARPGARTMALIGNGAQAEFQSLAFHAMAGITTVRAFDIDPTATARLMRNLAKVPGLAIVPVGSVGEALTGADIVTTVTADKTRATILTPDMVQPGMHLNAVGGDCPGKTELHVDILRNARIVVEYAPQSRIEGEIQQWPEAPVSELWQVLSGAAPGRTRADEVTVFDSVGFALEDYSALRWLHAAAQARDVGRFVELVAMPPDPRDLYGWMMQTSGSAIPPVVSPLPQGGRGVGGEGKVVPMETVVS
ncbi:ornithine cyclodeaminase [Cupriavidus sp.]|uniref:ornithine cyclodeaminase n=1 Tax=Cupriavidus sp. TaxID=1873897 RepID=UPI0025C3458C|nr:ornithine cyclodeaminase [Cupriavidus sp.]MCA3192516.1 ornithine cyclodeaminase [Cupriavidus sp.]MCA3200111.1 ornithine cyclodeaminase [Cupriavidus sp.]MCA3203530.1 ornithine cyclodeaminase [Cupriavidus sp.]MCA3208794.1 ornithine cyclodeaminase [Cupriavidus sp.]